MYYTDRYLRVDAFDGVTAGKSYLITHEVPGIKEPIKNCAILVLGNVDISHLDMHNVTVTRYVEVPDVLADDLGVVKAVMTLAAAIKGAGND